MHLRDWSRRLIVPLTPQRCGECCKSRVQTHEKRPQPEQDNILIASRMAYRQFQLSRGATVLFDESQSFRWQHGVGREKDRIEAGASDLAALSLTKCDLKINAGYAKAVERH